MENLECSSHGGRYFFLKDVLGIYEDIFDFPKFGGMTAI